MATGTAQTSVWQTVPAVQETAMARTATIPWYIWCALTAVTSVMVGAIWDISWHMSIGRDTFWTPAHMAIYLCGVLAGVAFSYIVLTTTFKPTAPLRDSSVRIWGFRAPLGAFIASWGGIAMLTSAPFDDWWHGAYGLDVQIISPPHIVLFLGVYGVLLGTMVLIAGHMNRTTAASRKTFARAFVYGCGIVLTMMMTMLFEYTGRSMQHTSQPYLVLSLCVPIILAVAAGASGFHWAATWTAGLYTLFYEFGMVVLPLFPAQPKLGPVYQHVTHFIPLGFPILLIVPAFALDLLWQRTRGWKPWKLAAVSAVVFVTALMAAQWPFADFLMSPYARNWFFGSHYFWYGQPPTAHDVRNLFWDMESSLHFWITMALALALGTLTFRLGLSRGKWLREIQR